MKTTAAAGDSKAPREKAKRSDRQATAKTRRARRYLDAARGLELRWAVGGLLVLLVFGSVASFPPAKEPTMPPRPAGMTTDTETMQRAQRAG